MNNDLLDFTRPSALITIFDIEEDEEEFGKYWMTAEHPVLKVKARIGFYPNLLTAQIQLSALNLTQEIFKRIWLKRAANNAGKHTN